MECNKEEAIRAKGIAESKMQNKEFSVARKIALKAQKLYTSLENISQMLMVCDVHCAAEQKIFGNETDWYGILQIEQKADEGTIKKQYKKFALLLHPDKNKFPGAESAFKLIGEAQRVLLDPGKRAMLDMKRRASVSKPVYRPQPKPSWPSSVGMQTNSRTNFTSFNPQQQQRQPQPQQGNLNGRPTFWTTCPYCAVRYQYCRDVIHKSIFCKSCSKAFIAYESFGPETTRPPNLNRTTSSQQTFQKPGVASTVRMQCKTEPVRPGNPVAENSKTQFSPKPGATSTVRMEKVSGRKKRKQGEESIESINSESSSDAEEDVVMDDIGEVQSKLNADGLEGECLRRSERRRQKVSYNENVSDDDETSPPKKVKGSGSSCATEEGSGDVLKEEAKATVQSSEAAGVKEQEIQNKDGGASFEKVILNEKKQDEKMNGKRVTVEDGLPRSSGTPDDIKEENVDIDCSDPETYSYPDPDFYDFDQNRNEGSFAVGQIWAVYDTVDAMPRFYARIRKVFSPGFKLRITWLEPDPDDENEMKWAHKELPVSCGKYKNGNSENTEDRLTFSHLMRWEKGDRRDTFKILPRKGETWALFKNWNMKWCSDIDNNRKYEYEFVEVLSEYSEGIGATVAYLAKVRGFVSLFCRTAKDGKDTHLIPSVELFRFAHRVPCFELTGAERAAVPRRSFELDPASLPTGIEEIDPQVDLKVEVGIQPTGSCSKLSDNLKTKPQPATSSSEAEEKDSHVQHKGSDPEDCIVIEDDSPHAAEPDELPDPEFFKFESEKSQEKFNIDQIWSLYCPEDGLPKYYGQIKKIVCIPAFKLYLRWLEPSPPQQQNGLIRWRDKKMPAGCGRFKLGSGKMEEYTTTDAFSHLMQAESAGKKNDYVISPKSGEVWALYRNWTAEIKCSELDNCKYDIVEVVKADETVIGVQVLEKVDGFASLFKTQMQGKLPVSKVLNPAELLKFSHQIPAFRLTNERGGSLRGFLELDPLAVPVHYFSK